MGGTDNITNVSLITLSDTPPANASPYYFDRTGVQNAIPTLAAGSSEVVSVTMGTDANQYSRVWIDFNQNGTFEATESFSLGTNAGANGTSSITINIPIGATTGLTRMRVRAGDDVAILNTQACNASSSTYGQALDYSVNICSPPTVVSVSGAGTFCGSTTITASGGTGGTIYFQGTTSGGTSTTTASSSETITTSGTYYFRSRSASGCWGPQGSVVVTITPQVTPSVALSSTNTIFCGVAPSPITYTATPTNGGGTPTYQWYLNDVLVQSGTSATYAVNSPQNADLVYCVMTTTLTCVSASTATSTSIITTSFPTTPGNDECVTTIPLTVGVATSGSTGCATASAGMPAVCSGTADDDVWYSFVASETEHIVEIEGQGAFNAVLQVFSGSCGGLTQLSCNNIQGLIESTWLSGLTIGQTYYIRIFSEGNNSSFQGSFMLTVREKCVSLSNPILSSNSPVCEGNTINLTNNDPLTSFSVSNSVTGAINDNTWLTRSLVVSGTGFNANQLSTAVFNSIHTYTADLDIYLTSPSGVTIELSTDNGLGSDNYTNTTFSTTGPSITTGTGPFTGTFTPEQPFSNFTGPADGIWVLRIFDDLGGGCRNFSKYNA